MKKLFFRLLSAICFCLFGLGCGQTELLPDLMAGPRDGVRHGYRRCMDDIPSSVSGKELTLVTYNVANLGHGGDQTDNVVKFIQESGADLVGLNEIDSCNGRHDVNQMKVLAGKLGGWDFYFAKALDFAGGSYGNGALSVKPILNATTVAIPRGSGHEPRSIALIETEDVVFGAVHLDFGPPGEPSYEQVQFLNNWFAERYIGYGKPVILCGDFNTDPGTPTQDEMERCWTRLSEPVLTWPTGTSSMCLDYIFCFKGAVPVTAIETARPTGIIDLDTASDHYPVRVKIRFEKNPAGIRPDRGIEKGTLKVGSVALYGTAANNAMAMHQAVDTKGLAVENLFEAYLPSMGGNLVVIDDAGNNWRLQEGGRLIPGEGFDTIPAADCATILLRLDFNSLRWESIAIKGAELRPATGGDTHIDLYYKGGGQWQTRDSFVPANVYSKYYFKVISDRPESLYAWIRCADGSVGGVGEAGFSSDLAFTAISSLMNTKVIVRLNLLERTQQMRENR